VFIEVKPAKPTQLLHYLEKSSMNFYRIGFFFFFKKIKLKTANWLYRKKITARFMVSSGGYCTQTHSGPAASRVRAPLYPSDYVQEHQTHPDCIKPNRHLTCVLERAMRDNFPIQVSFLANPSMWQGRGGEHQKLLVQVDYPRRKCREGKILQNSG